MADDILNMSLDDIIKRNADKTKEKRSARPEKRETGGRSNGIKKVQSGGVTKAAKVVPVKAPGRVANVGKPGPRRERVAPEVARRAEAVKRAALDGDGKWQHDKFQEVAAGAPRRTVTAGAGRDSGAMKLVVSNLDFSITEDDVTELFATCGRLKRVKLQYDRSGRSEGVAEVEFEVSANADKAKRQYNGAMLDGRAMQLEVVPVSQRAGVQTLSSGVRLQLAGANGAASNGAAPSRTNLQIPRTLVQAATPSAGRPAPRQAGRPQPRGRLQSEIRQVRGRGTVTEFMEE